MKNFDIWGLSGKFDEILKDSLCSVRLERIDGGRVEIKFVDVFRVIFKEDLVGVGAVKGKAGNAFVGFCIESFLH